ncbi:MAG: gliding motility-associated C-terminal domain-containing protein [Lewinellaceae bacterium]|nr:gliding motility-associated C-terminal domain-containing protein [Saprospiraceae bacterium]MCB9336756.1 gliding motility-associated C-terminal domain-containing protein [Lewinellaceae bacterium]
MKLAKLTIILSLALQAQVARAQFILNGSAVQTNDSCWTLTPAQEFRAGSMWNIDKIDLNNSFQVIMELNFGCKDNDGADGILFGFQPVGTSIGTAGEGLGFQNVAPSLGIEFDTWQNANLADPSLDHLAISKNGDLNHASSSNLAGPVQAGTTANIEDCDWHKLRVNWDAPSNTIQVYFDCELRLTYTGDIVNEIFGGDPLVFWGFTAATGGSSNVQQVCYSYTSFLDGFEDVTICPGGQYQLQVGGGTSYHWTPATGLSNPDIPNPIAAPEQTTTYLVEVLDGCNNPFYDSITVAIDGDTVFFDLGPDTIICEGGTVLLDATSVGTQNVAYQWSNGSTAPSITTDRTGHYEVTVTVDNYCVADDRVNVTVIPLPTLDQLGDNLSLCLGQTVVLHPSSLPGLSYEWQDGSTQDSFVIAVPGSYSLTASNSCGEVTSTIFVEYEDCRQVYFPNAFSPNGDGINDVFLPFDDGDVGSISYFRVFDRWGGLVFEVSNALPNDFSQGWDGTVAGKKAEQGVYVWLAEVVFRDGEKVRMGGDVTLLRF